MSAPETPIERLAEHEPDLATEKQHEAFHELVEVEAARLHLPLEPPELEAA